MKDRRGATPLIIDNCFDSAPLLHNTANRLKAKIGEILFFEPAIEIFFGNMVDKYGESPAWDIVKEVDFPIGLEEAQEMMTIFRKINDEPPRLYQTLQTALHAVHPGKFDDALEALEALWKDENSRYLLIAVANIFFLILGVDALERGDLPNPADDDTSPVYAS
ncbi:MAG: hypothetical protein PHW53_02140 [Patescibacteria group bacterium]|nr:hypothetical protein [Patescibacteria group bacterium]